MSKLNSSYFQDDIDGTKTCCMEPGNSESGSGRCHLVQVCEREKRSLQGTYDVQLSCLGGNSVTNLAILTAPGIWGGGHKSLTGKRVCDVKEKTEVDNHILSLTKSKKDSWLHTSGRISLFRYSFGAFRDVC